MKSTTKILLLIIAAFIIFIIAFTALSNENNEIPMFYCNIDEDCIKVQEGCCGCSEGGSEIAINKQFKDEYLQEIYNNYDARLCTQVISQNETCFPDSQAKCVDNEYKIVIEYR